MMIKLLLALTLIFSSVVTGNIEEETTRDRIIAHGYPAEHHRIDTEDGNVLSVFRIPCSHKLQNQNKTCPIVLLQHGLQSSSDIWIASGPNNALPFLLADAGFDVWIGNIRGNTYSKKLKIPIWNFSWHEIGYYDIAAMIDYALKTNGQGQKSIHYVGHSQGTTVFFTLMSMRPEYNEKIKTAHMLAPVAFMQHLKSECISLLSYWLKADGSLTRRFFNRECTSFWTFVTSKFYSHERMYLNSCYKLMFASGSEHSNKSAIEEADRRGPGGGCCNQLLHYLFNYESGHFRQYDFATEKNLEVYKSEQPPDYPVEKITSQVHLWYGDNDELVAGVDVLALADRLPKKILHHIEDSLWEHTDFTVHNEVRKYINDPVIKIIQQYELESN